MTSAERIMWGYESEDAVGLDPLVTTPRPNRQIARIECIECEDAIGSGRFSGTFPLNKRRFSFSTDVLSPRPTIDSPDRGSFRPAAASTPDKFDAFVGSKKVHQLTQNNFKDFIQNKEMSMVMFYDPADGKTEGPKKELIKAAETTRRASHAYASVDCQSEPQLCRQENVTFKPFFKIYSLGLNVGFITDPSGIQAFAMKNIVELISTETKTTL